MERAGLMQELEEMEQEHGHIEVRIAREKFRLFAFRWRIMNRVSKMKKFDRDSYDFMRANLEIQELVKVDMEQRLQKATAELKEKYRQSEQEREELQD